MRTPSSWVVVPAHDEEARIGACLAALAAQPAVRSGELGVVVVLDGCRDGTAGLVARAAPSLTVVTTRGPACGSGPARRHGMEVARELANPDVPGALLLSTDADTRVARDWHAQQEAAARLRGAQAIGGRIRLDPVEARALPAGVVAARADAAAGRLAAVRAHSPWAEHHQFSGGSLAVTPAAFDAVGGLPAVETLEDEALERVLLAAGIRIDRLAAVEVVTSARSTGRATGGLADALRGYATAVRDDTRPPIADG